MKERSGESECPSHEEMSTRHIDTWSRRGTEVEVLPDEIATMSSREAAEMIMVRGLPLRMITGEVLDNTGLDAARSSMF